MLRKTTSSKTSTKYTESKRPTKAGITDARAQEIVMMIRDLGAELGPSLVRLKPSKRRGMLRMPPQSKSVMALVVEVARERRLLVEPVGETRLEKAAALAARLAAPVSLIDSLRQRMQDTMRVAEADAWGETTALYTALMSIARYDVVLGMRLAVAREFFKKRRKGSGKARAKGAATKKKASE